jgi:hypothetical protein
MKKILLCLGLILVFSVASLAMGHAPQKKAAYPFLVDNLEDGNNNKDPEWFVFDGLILTIVKNSTLQTAAQASSTNVGEYSLKLSGSATNWYVGGMGTLPMIDASGYDALELDVYGTGPDSGKLKIEFYDDDHNSKEIEVDKNWKPLYDDLFTAEIAVDWTGWKHVAIPLNTFKVEGNGNKAWDPTTKNGSSGLKKIQLIALATSQTGSVDFNVDDLELTATK